MDPETAAILATLHSNMDKTVYPNLRDMLEVYHVRSVRQIRRTEPRAVLLSRSDWRRNNAGPCGRVRHFVGGPEDLDILFEIFRA